MTSEERSQKVGRKENTNMTTEHYRLTVSGIVTYTPEDFSIRDLLLSQEGEKAKIAEALQELEEEAQDVKITLEKI